MRLVLSVAAFTNAFEHTSKVAFKEKPRIKDNQRLEKGRNLGTNESRGMRQGWMEKLRAQLLSTSVTGYLDRE